MVNRRVQLLPVSSQDHVRMTASRLFGFCSLFQGLGTVDIPTTRRVYETVKSGLEKIGANYPIGKLISRALRLCSVPYSTDFLIFSAVLIKEGTRPNYWRPDSDCRACFICKSPFNSTTNRLHHWYARHYVLFRVYR